MIDLDLMEGAISQYGESAVSHLVSRFGNRQEIIGLIDIGAMMNLHRISKYDYDGKAFTKRE